MPIVELHILKGYKHGEKQRLGEALTDAVLSVVPAKPDLVTVMIHEMDNANYYRGRQSRVSAAALPDPQSIVLQYLQAMENRKLDTATTFLSDGFVMQFPAAEPMTKLEQLIEWAAPRYQSVRKTYDGFDAMQGAGDAAIVYCRGHLSGEWPDGSSFQDIRFIDRFELIDGKITRQDVWNDIAETKAQV